jgi:hypothetical protein
MFDTLGVFDVAILSVLEVGCNLIFRQSVVFMLTYVFYFLC